ncbi:hypothetical protein PIB30_096767 [Stylosanthes scabra]|uniref:Uncharacterized protein n=1 Tax=Stylosanthes scabra TaxID=79078 RepID=A0ABU6XVD4_9FABA|nr:hypothetical protein [Stylosanthes scabra]
MEFESKLVSGENEIYAKIQLVAESIVVDARRRGPIMCGGNKSAVSLAIVPILSSMQIMLGGTKEGPPFAELHFRIESPSVNLLDACVAAEAIEVRVVDESASSLPTGRNNDFIRGKVVVIDISSSSSKLKAYAERSPSHAHETSIAETLLQGIEFQFSIIHGKHEELNNDLIKKGMEIVHKCIDDAKMEKREVHEVINVHKVVAYGFALFQATVFSKSYSIVPNTTLVDVTSLSLGVATHGDLRSVVLLKNTVFHENNLLGVFLFEKLSLVCQVHHVNGSFKFDFHGILNHSEEAEKIAWSIIIIDEIHSIAIKWEKTYGEC